MKLNICQVCIISLAYERKSMEFDPRSTQSLWISTRLRRKAKSAPDLRRSIALSKEYKIRKKFIAIIGEDGTGRNTLIRRFMDMDGGPFLQPEIGRRTPRSALVDLKKRPNLERDYLLNLLIFIFNLQQMSVRRMHESLAQLESTTVVFDVTNRNTFATAINCMVRISEVLGSKAPKFILVGNKIDLPDRQITKRRGRRVADIYGAQGYYECSAHMNTKVGAVLDAILFMAF